MSLARLLAATMQTRSLPIFAGRRLVSISHTNSECESLVTFLALPDPAQIKEFVKYDPEVRRARLTPYWSQQSAL